jgi:chemotaxis protein MotB
MNADKVVRVVGLADSSLLVKDDPRSPLNRRISIIVLNKIAEERMNRAGGEIEAGTPAEVEQALPAAGAALPVPSTPAAAVVPAR